MRGPAAVVDGAANDVVDHLLPMVHLPPTLVRETGQSQGVFHRRWASFFHIICQEVRLQLVSLAPATLPPPTSHSTEVPLVPLSCLPLCFLRHWPLLQWPGLPVSGILVQAPYLGDWWDPQFFLLGLHSYI